MNNTLTNWFIKKTSGHRLFYKDVTDGLNFSFYYKFTKDNDLSIMSFDRSAKTYREFIIDDVIVKAMFDVVAGLELSTSSLVVDKKGALPAVAEEYVKAGFTVLKKTGRSKFANVVVLGKSADFGTGKTKSKSLVLRRVVYNDVLTIGIDTLALPLNAVKAFVKTMTKYFKDESRFTESSLLKNKNKGTK